LLGRLSQHLRLSLSTALSSLLIVERHGFVARLSYTGEDAICSARCSSPAWFWISAQTSQGTESSDQNRVTEVYPLPGPKFCFGLSRCHCCETCRANWVVCPITVTPVRKLHLCFHRSAPFALPGG